MNSKPSKQCGESKYIYESKNVIPLNVYFFKIAPNRLGKCDVISGGICRLLEAKQEAPLLQITSSSVLKNNVQNFFYQSFRFLVMIVIIRPTLAPKRP